MRLKAVGGGPLLASQAFLVTFVDNFQIFSEVVFAPLVDTIFLLILHNIAHNIHDFLGLALEGSSEPTLLCWFPVSAFAFEAPLWLRVRGTMAGTPVAETTSRSAFGFSIAVLQLERSILLRLLSLSRMPAAHRPMICLSSPPLL